MNLTNPPCLTSFLPDDTSDSRNSCFQNKLFSTEEATKMHKLVAEN